MHANRGKKFGHSFRYQKTLLYILASRHPCKGHEQTASSYAFLASLRVCAFTCVQVTKLVVKRKEALQKEPPLGPPLDSTAQLPCINAQLIINSNHRTELWNITYAFFAIATRQTRERICKKDERQLCVDKHKITILVLKKTTKQNVGCIKYVWRISHTHTAIAGTAGCTIRCIPGVWILCFA